MDKPMTISQHLEDLRKRVLRSVLAIAAISFFILSFHLTPFMYNGIKLYYPTFSPFDNMAAQVTVSMKHLLLPSTVQLIQTAPGQAFFSQFYIAILLGMVFAMPIIVKEFVGFLAPALHRKEIQIIRNITIPAIVLFTVGGLFSYLIFFTNTVNLQVCSHFLILWILSHLYSSLFLRLECHSSYH